MTISAFSGISRFYIRPAAFYSVDQSEQALRRARELSGFGAAIAALRRLARDRGYPPISSKTIGVALDLAERLPFNRPLPKVSVDEDGDILMFWELGEASCGLTIQGEVLHIVTNPGENSTHLSPVVYEDRVVNDLIDRIPADS